jgi:F-type H+-transporting ATPase subunit b
MRQLASWLAVLFLFLAVSVSFATRPESAPAHDTDSHAATTTGAAGDHGAGKHAAADPAAEEIHLGTFVVTVVIFVVLLIVLRFTAWKPIMKGLQDREHAIRDSIDAARKAKEDADRTTRELEAKMSEVQRQAAQQLAQAKTDAQKVADSIRAQAETESAALKERTLREIDAAKQQAVTEINSHAAELGTAVASKILQRSVTAEDQQKLVEESLHEMARKN